MSQTVATTGAVATVPVTTVSNVKFENGVYIIFCKWDVKKIEQHCRFYGDVLWSRLVYDKDNQETDRTYVILPDETYQGLVEDGYGEDRKRSTNSNKAAGFRVAPYILREDQEHTDTRTLFVPAPKEHRDSCLAVENTVDAKLRTLASFGILPVDSWHITVPPVSRESGEVKSGAFISFTPAVERGRIAMVRLLINDTYWPEVEGEETLAVFRCYWENRDRTVYPAKAQGAKTPAAKAPYGVNSAKKNFKDLSPEEREKLQEERRLAHVAKLLVGAIPANAPVLTKK